METLNQVMREYGDTQREVAKLLGITESTMSLKVNGKAEFKASEIAVLSERYALTPEEVSQVFLSGK